MREPRAARLLVGRADVIPDVDGRYGNGRVAMQDHVEPVVEPELAERDVDGRLRRGAGDELRHDERTAGNERRTHGGSLAESLRDRSCSARRCATSRQLVSARIAAMTATARAFGVARSLAMYYGIPFRAQRLRRFYSQFVRPGALCFDVGAHAGNRVRCWRALGARVVAIEPQRDFVRILRWLYGGDDG